MRSLLTLSHALFLSPSLILGSTFVSDVLTPSSTQPPSSDDLTPSLSSLTQSLSSLGGSLTQSFLPHAPTPVALSPGEMRGETNSSTTVNQMPSQVVGSATRSDIEQMQARRIADIVGTLRGDTTNVSAWMASLGPDGKWPDSEVDYTTGCTARRANWPAQAHWQRILRMAVAWHNGTANNDQFFKDSNLRQKISLAIDYWFGRDITNLACLNEGGFENCPCDNPENRLWNTNWYSNIILIPSLAGQTCLLLNDTLTTSQFDHCTNMTGRSYDLFLRPLEEVGFLTGANILDVARLGIDGALLNFNLTQLTDAYRRIHREVVIQEQPGADGIRPDGSFGQHIGIIYNGNYGNVFFNDILGLELDAGGTQFAANEKSRSAIVTLLDGDLWMVFYNTITGKLHWDFSVLGRFISFPVADKQATGGIGFKFAKIQELGKLWDSSDITQFAEKLSGSSNNANMGHVVGNRMFYTSDYMVHRGDNYVSTLKMYSSRTNNTECLNNQNPFGFHLSDGVQYTYLKGNEYEDISGAWDWNLVPGITTDYGGTNLSCSETRFSGNESFVGGVSNGKIGVAVMRYTNPLTRALQWQKAWFFLEDDVQHVMISNITSTSNNPVLSVLDQRRHDGPIYLDGGVELVPHSKSGSSTGVKAGNSLWHGGVGYTLSNLSPTDSIHIDVGEKTGNWSTIGISTQPPITVDLFAAWIEHGSPNTSTIAYSAFPGTTSYDTFLAKQSTTDRYLRSIVNDGSVSAVFDERHKTAMVVFWEKDRGGSVTVSPASSHSNRMMPVTISSNRNAVVMYKFEDAAIWVSDPSQSLDKVEIELKLSSSPSSSLFSRHDGRGKKRKPPHWGIGNEKRFVVELPTGAMAGSSVRVDFEIV